MLEIIVSSILIIIIVIIYTRIIGLRTFAKMTSFDFAITLATGSIVASVAVAQTKLIEGALAITCLFTLQFIIGYLRKHTNLDTVTDNTPLLLMKNGKFMESNLEKTNVTKADVMAKLRKANVSKIDSVHMVVLENTGDISVLFGNKKPDEMIIENIKQ